MAGWEQRAKKLEARRTRMNKHGRSLLTAVRDAEMRRAKAAKRKARFQGTGGEEPAKAPSGPSQGG